MSNPFLDALKQQLKVSIRFITQVIHIGIEAKSFRVPLVICIAEHSLLFLDCSFDKFLGEVFYTHIIKVVEQENSSTDVIRFEYSDQRPSGIPKKMTLICSEKKKLLMYLKCCWETDHVWRVSKIAALKIHAEKIDLKRYKDQSKLQYAKDAFLKPPAGKVRKELDGYGFFMLDEFESTGIHGEYKGLINSQLYAFILNIEEPKFIELFYTDLRTAAENAINRVFPFVENYGISVNTTYNKKFNLVMDKSKWEGWQIDLITETSYVSMILLRRKFIPPMADSGQDLYISAIGGPAASIHCSELADSLYTLSVSNEIYTAVISQKSEALIMTTESMLYYSSMFNIKPTKIYYAFQVLLSILVIINKQTPDPFTKKLIEDIRKNPESINPDAEIERIEDPNRILEDFCKSSNFNKTSREYGVWCQKVYRYVVFSLDGGLMNYRFRLEDLILNLMKLNQDGRDIARVKLLFTKLLNLHDRNNEEEFEDIQSGVVKMLETSGFELKHGKDNVFMNNTSWVFNQRIMESFIQTGFLKRELEGSRVKLAFPKLLIYLIQNKTMPILLKTIVCKALIGMNESTDILALKAVMPHLLELYLSKNSILAAEAAKSLVNLSSTNKEIKQFLYTYRTDIISRLLNKDNKLLIYTILLLINLSSDHVKKKEISKDSRENIRKIIVGSKFYKNSVEVIAKSLQILTIFVKDHNNAEYFSSDEELVVECLKLLGENEENDIKILEFFEAMLSRSQTAKVLMLKKGVGLMVIKLSKLIHLESIKKILRLIKTLIVYKNEEIYLSLHVGNARKELDFLMQRKNLVSDQELVEQINELRDLPKFSYETKLSLKLHLLVPIVILNRHKIQVSFPIVLHSVTSTSLYLP